MKPNRALRASSTMLLALAAMNARAADTATTTPPPPTTATAAGTAFEVQAKGVPAAGAVMLISHLAGQDMVMYGVPDGTRIDLSGQYAGPDDFFQRTAAQLGLKAQKMDGINLLHRPCTDDPPQRYPFLSSNKLSLHFQRVELKAILGVFHDYFNLKRGANPLERAQPGRVALRLKDLPGERVLSAVMAATGLRLVEENNAGARAFHFEQAPQPVGCELFNGSTADAAGFEPTPTPTSTNSGWADNTPQSRLAKELDRTRQPLEIYDLEKIVLRGHAKAGGKTFGLAETPDGLMWGLGVGNYLGKNFGRVREVRPDRVLIREIRQNMFGFWQEVSLEIALQPGAGKGAAFTGASRYEEAITRIHTHARFLQDMPGACAAHFPDSAAANSAALGRWQTANAKELSELAPHVRAYAQRQADGLKDTAAPKADQIVSVTDEDLRDGLRLLLQRELPNGKARRNCAFHPEYLAQATNQLSEKFAAEWAVLRSCQADGFCPNLEQARR